MDDVRLREHAESLSSDVCEPFFGDLLKSDSRDCLALLLLALQFPAMYKRTPFVRLDTHLDMDKTSSFVCMVSECPHNKNSD